MISFVELFDQIRKGFEDLEEIKNLNSDEIIGKVFSQTWCIDWDKVFGDNDLRSDVSIESCNKIRDAGTKFFQNNQLSESLDLYNSYIRSCHRLRENGEIKNQLIFQGLLMITLTNVWSLTSSSMIFSHLTNRNELRSPTIT